MKLLINKDGARMHVYTPHEEKRARGHGWVDAPVVVKKEPPKKAAKKAKK